MAQTLESVLKRDDLSPRLSIGDTWLVWGDGEWLVWYHQFGARTNKCLYRGDDLNKALEVLTGEGKEATND